MSGELELELVGCRSKIRSRPTGDLVKAGAVFAVAIDQQEAAGGREEYLFSEWAGEGSSDSTNVDDYNINNANNARQVVQQTLCSSRFEWRRGGEWKVKRSIS